MNTPEPQQKGNVRKLGRGLSSLLGTPVQINVPAAQSQPRAVEAVAAPAPTPPNGASGVQGLREISVHEIVPNRRQPRMDFDESALRSLAESIRTAGLMQPVVVRPSTGGYELVAGERRWRAAKLIGIASIPAIIRELDDQAAAELAIIENIQREDLNPIERAGALRRLASDFELTHQQVADRVGLDRATVTNLLRLSELDQGTAELVRSGKLSQGHAKALLGLGDLAARSRFASRAVAEEWSVRELERRVQAVQRGAETVPHGTSSTSSDPTARDANVADLERQLAEHLGTRTKIQLGRKKGSGRLIIEFYTLDQFDGLMGKMGFGSRL